MMKFMQVISLFCLSLSLAYADSHTIRRSKINNEEVKVWETVVFPGKANILKMHRHEHNRVIIALDDGILKITNDKGKKEYLHLKKNTPYFLAKNAANELHMDENQGAHPIRILVIELKKS